MLVKLNMPAVDITMADKATSSIGENPVRADSAQATQESQVAEDAQRMLMFRAEQERMCDYELKCRVARECGLFS
jgi:hypothetical protein